MIEVITLGIFVVLNVCASKERETLASLEVSAVDYTVGFDIFCSSYNCAFFNKV